MVCASLPRSISAFLLSQPKRKRFLETSTRDQVGDTGTAGDEEAPGQWFARL